MQVDPHAIFVNSSCMDLLLIEMIPVMKRLTLTTMSSPQVRRDLGFEASSLAAIQHEDDEREAIYGRLELLGFKVGQRLVERFSQNKPRFMEPLDIIKFICKDIWMLLFKKQIDNLKTNHKGVYVLTDYSFSWFLRMSTKVGGQDAIDKAQIFLWFPCGMLRGILTNLGEQCTVIADTANFPGCTFQIKLINS
ncbi:hypothetical protein MERGE_001490 [Pneumocystis wakefieldiae]|uniref:Trafficking protein particle complex subunit 6B n=1 Tax=Pneumocystis wakefieldiae TaxID=38082 RepID=A0A899FZ51_9ASCO|nr:hypothetical protein MERGE_001490 [Pneumocystis wakefieldiae]